MSLLKDFLNGLENEQNVWKNYGTSIDAPIDNFNKKSKATYLGNVTDNGLGFVYCTLYSRVGQYDAIAYISVSDELKIAKFLDILEESARTLESAKKENLLTPKQLSYLNLI